ncbi:MULTISPECIES: SPOR domain-containing protein [unclassified Colwellia]|uniref:SPOR domain-containing protein n=1 Tax=unclassified Colwellia TaxID=196834 RepID=UPI0015F6E0E2|nr:MULTISPECIES: SPOR domain-containing protein [unclassified Colwellia]MBA6232343.1 SPOR domain-containing protein [Colwellia sp. MB02u-7]MBA6236019.1 SPOR domain-containing protein [Colwellia sp. MB02u-11]MBA6256727.1 SPOR domain-containing protein [Colwellia sp. MB3u-28]MBA6261442.1 SPOR domain-containing protein [Colwellia sp. MB3u-41]MBA6298576.1 SPOR domain-containing protein [Colwellia sp. MB3u-22]
MAHQDYVSRAQNKKKSPYKSKVAPKPTFTVKFKLVLLLAILLIGGFSYGLWAIKDKKPSTSPVKVVKEDTRVVKEKALPAPPKEIWAYVDNLQSKEVEVGKYEVKDKGPYKMQCASFRTMKQAEILKATIAFTGLTSQISESKGKNGIYYKVFLGPYERKREAEKDKHKLKSNNVNGCQIWFWK